MTAFLVRRVIDKYADAPQKLLQMGEYIIQASILWHPQSTHEDQASARASINWLSLHMDLVARGLAQQLERAGSAQQLERAGSILTYVAYSLGRVNSGRDADLTNEEYAAMAEELLTHLDGFDRVV